jgi:adenylate cyclase
MDARPVERKLAAILSADAVGFSRLMGDDEAATVRAIVECREVIGSAVGHHGGRVVDAPGDNVLAEFPSVVDAVQAALDIQRELSARNAALPAARQMWFRIGINLGDVIVEGDRLYGDGVNIAARLEGLAEGGGICLSGTAYDQVVGKLPLDWKFLGEHTVKNIARPVRVYRTRLEAASPAGAAPTAKRRAGRWSKARIAGAVGVVVLLGVAGWAGWRWLGTQASASLPLPDRPSVAVLPFTNLSRDPAQEYFSDGVTEDLITGLSKVSGLFVIARNSVFTYKGKAVKIRDVGRDLGVRYVLEGGIQRSGSRVRVTAQLVDAVSGYHVWAERYDREVSDVFALQDEVTQQIVRALAVKLTAGEQARMRRTPTSVPEVYDLVLRGNDERRRTTREGNAEARRLLVRALDLDPSYAPAYCGLSWAYLQGWQFLWSGRESLDRARELAERGIALDVTLADGHRLMAQIHLWQKEHDLAIREAERGVALAPNDADAHETLAEVYVWSGRPEESVAIIRRAMRLNPHYPFFYLWTLGHAYYLTGRAADAVDTFDTLVEQNPNFLPGHVYRAVVLLELGRTKEARSAWERAEPLSPGASMASIRERLPYRRPADLDRFLSAVHRLGMPSR